MPFEADAFVSYAHLDNIELVEGRPGWIANFCRALDVRLAQLLGSDARVWWDPKLQGNDVFAETLIDRLRSVASLVAVVSPRYLKSEWTRRELAAFCDAANQQGGLRVGDKTRIFKVLKTPVPLEDSPPELQAVLGYEFFKVDPQTDRARELDEIFGAEAQREFWVKLDDLAHDICAMLTTLRDAPAPGAPPAPQPDAPTVYLALTTADLRDSRDAIKRDLEQHGYVVLPDRPISLDADGSAADIRQCLERSIMSIHMIGRTYSFVPEGCHSSVAEMQYELGIERAAQGRFSRLVWIPPGLDVEDDRQRSFLQTLRMDPRMHGSADLLETSLEDLRTTIGSWLSRGYETARGTNRRERSPDTLPQVYLIYDQRDAAVVGPWEDFLFQSFEVLRPVFEGDEAEVREYHEENLRTCAGALILHGSGNEIWLRRKLRDLQKIVGYGRTLPRPVVGISLLPPATPDKARFRTHEALLFSQCEGFSAECLQPFVDQVKQLAAASPDDGAKASA